MSRLAIGPRTGRARALLKTLAAVLLLASVAVADPAPFGLELGKTTQGEAGTRYQLRHRGISALTGGDLLDLDPRQVRMQGVRSIRLVFDRYRVLLGVYVELPADRFEEMRNVLAAKYRLLTPVTQGTADRLARLVDGRSEIVLTASPADYAVLRLTYTHRRLHELAESQPTQASRERPAQIESEL